MTEHQRKNPLSVLRAARERTSPSRSSVLTLTERIGAVTPLLSSLEYLARRPDREKGGFNNWDVMRLAYQNAPKCKLRFLDLVGNRSVTDALHITRAGASAVLLAGPTARRPRLAANLLLAVTSAALAPRHHYGNDGSDQASFVVQVATAAARASEKHPQAVDACMWLVALQSALSYTASGWSKVASPTWRSGQALPGIMRTRSYGEVRVWHLLQRHPRVSDAVGASVLAMECLFPTIFAKRWRTAPALTALMAVFHLVNGRVMGLGRFIWSFGAMYPAIWYVTEVPRADSTRQARNDGVPMLAMALVAAVLTVGAAASVPRSRALRRGWGDERTLLTSAGNTLAYRCSGPLDATGPVLVLEGGLLEPPEYFGWLTAELSRRWTTVTYHRAGSGPSSYSSAEPCSVDSLVRDLTDLAGHVSENRPVMLIGHSFGGYLAFLAASRASWLVRAACLLDSSHPAQLQKSGGQIEGAAFLHTSFALAPLSLRLGWGPLLRRPPWIRALPAGTRKLAADHYADARSWSVGRREWRAMLQHFRDFDGKLPTLDAPLLVITAGDTAVTDAAQRELHQELAEQASWADTCVIDNASHTELLTDTRTAARVTALIDEFAIRLTVDPERRSGPDAHGTARART